MNVCFLLLSVRRYNTAGSVGYAGGGFGPPNLFFFFHPHQRQHARPLGAGAGAHRQQRHPGRAVGRDAPDHLPLPRAAPALLSRPLLALRRPRPRPSRRRGRRRGLPVSKGGSNRRSRSRSRSRSWSWKGRGQRAGAVARALPLRASRGQGGWVRNRDRKGTRGRTDDDTKDMSTHVHTQRPQHL